MSPTLVSRILSAGRGNGLRAQLVRGATGVGALKFLSIPLSLAASVLLARVLGPEGFGKYAFIMSITTVLSLPLDKGMRQLITREVSSYHHSGNWALFRGLMRWAHKWVLLGSLLLGLIIGGFAVVNATWDVNDRWTLLLVGLVLLPFLSLNALRGANLRGLGYVVYAQLPEFLVRPGSHLAFAAILLGLGILNPATALMSQVVAAACAFLIGAYLLHQRRPQELSTATPAYRNADWTRAWVPFTLLMAASMLNNQIGILLLGWLGTDAQVAALRVADRGAQLVALSLGIVNLVIAPHITRAYQKGSNKRLQQISRQSARAALVVALPVAAPLILFGRPIIGLIFGAEYVEISVVPLAILAAAQLINVIFGSIGMFLVMSGFERDTLIGHIIALIINIVAAMIFIPLFGANGAAYAAAIGLVTWNTVLAVKFMQRLGLRPSAL